MNPKNPPTQPGVETVDAAHSYGFGAEQKARDLALRYRCEFIDLRDYRLNAELFEYIPVDLMFRYNFVPLEEQDGALWIAIADPSKLTLIDEISLLLGRRVKTKVALLNQIDDILKSARERKYCL